FITAQVDSFRWYRHADTQLHARNMLVFFVTYSKNNFLVSKNEFLVGLLLPVALCFFLYLHSYAR
ncbi:MAG: hypothetical protein PHW88_07945, partial [Bacteroidales bacterium]|nr:hypothetical protein [Bacteroidales bacterium]